MSATARVRPVMVVLLFGVRANAALNWALIFGHPGLPPLGMVGSGCSTAIVQWVMLLGLAGYMLMVPPAGASFRFSVQTRHARDLKN